MVFGRVLLTPWWPQGPDYLDLGVVLFWCCCVCLLVGSLCSRLGHHARARSKNAKYWCLLVASLFPWFWPPRSSEKQNHQTRHKTGAPNTHNSKIQIWVRNCSQLIKTMKEADANNDRTSQILVLFDVRGCPCGVIAFFFWPPLSRDTQKLKILMFSCGVSVLLNCHHAAARSKNHQARPSKWVPKAHQQKPDCSVVWRATCPKKHWKKMEHIEENHRY